MREHRGHERYAVDECKWRPLALERRRNTDDDRLRRCPGAHGPDWPFKPKGESQGDSHTTDILSGVSFVVFGYSRTYDMKRRLEKKLLCLDEDWRPVDTYVFVLAE